jgi:Uma2 family endonuclease
MRNKKDSHFSFFISHLNFMIAEATSYLESVKHLPENGTLLVHNVSWEEYEDILEEFQSKSAYRITYNDGVLKIMSPRPDHEFPKDVVLKLVTIYADEFDINLDSYGSTTYRRRRKSKGAEADTSFYIRHAAEVRGLKDFNLDVDPPPDVVVEIDVSNESLDKFEIYAALRVPEIWRFDGREFKIHKLSENKYQVIENSIVLHLISAKILGEFLEIGREIGQTAMVREFRKRLRQMK